MNEKLEQEVSGLRMYHKWAESELELQAQTIKRLEEQMQQLERRDRYNPVEDLLSRF
jgi:hypothetical protein